MANANQKRSDYERFKALNPDLNQQRLDETRRIIRSPMGPLQGRTPALEQAYELLFFVCERKYMEKRTREQHIRGLVGDLHVSLPETPAPEQSVAKQLEGTPGDYIEVYQNFKPHIPHLWAALRTTVRRIQRRVASHTEDKKLTLVRWDRYLFKLLCPNEASEMNACQRGKILRGFLAESGISWASYAEITSSKTDANASSTQAKGTRRHRK